MIGKSDFLKTMSYPFSKDFLLYFDRSQREFAYSLTSSCISSIFIPSITSELMKLFGIFDYSTSLSNDLSYGQHVTRPIGKELKRLILNCFLSEVSIFIFVKSL